MTLRGWSMWMLVGALGWALTGCGDTELVEVEAPRVAITGAWSVAEGATLQLTASTINGEDSSYTWASLDAAVATVDAAGVVTGVAAGEVVIEATGADSGLKGSRGVVVTAIPDAVEPGIPWVHVEGDFFMLPGATQTVTAETFNAADTGYTWTSSDELVVTVTAAGVVTANTDGQAVITATGNDSGEQGVLGIVVRTPPTQVEPVVFVTGDFVLGIGDTVTLTATTLHGTDSAYTWESSDESVALVDDAGVVQGMAAGEALITATGVDSGGVGTLGVAIFAEGPDGIQPPFFELWSNSGHGDATSRSFTNWDASGTVPASCARCHSEGGYHDYLGLDGSTPWVVDTGHPTGTTVTCTTCHNAVASQLDVVKFPSGVEIQDAGSSARCMQCHQGRQSMPQLDEKLAGAAAATPDTVVATLTFSNTHYAPAGATLYGSLAKGGYHYPGMRYDVKNHHVPGLDSCASCHNPHSLEVDLASCSGCHGNLNTAADLALIRMPGSVGDYDGDGNRTEGLKSEVSAVAATLYTAIRTYAKDVAGSPITYGSANPYFFIDTNDNGVGDPDETVGANSYKSFTPRLLKATFNYNLYKKDPGAYAHNGKYLLQLMHDAINDLNAALPTPVPFFGARGDGPHFDGASAAWRNWDASGSVSASCSKCHTGEGFKHQVEYGVTAAQAPENGLACLTCHTDSGPTFAMRTVNSVTYPGGKVLTSAGNVNNICATCHSGREGKATVDATIASASPSFRNIHYAPAAAMFAGNAATVGYEYTGKTYAGQRNHPIGAPVGYGCVNCHAPGANSHSFSVQEVSASCSACHGSTDVSTYRILRTADYDGDGTTAGSLAGELDGLRAKLLARIYAVASAAGTPIVYGTGNPYFFKDLNGNGVFDSNEGGSANRFTAWTPALLKATFNYQFVKQDKGAWAHNFDYAAQLLHDSIEDLGGDVSGLIRP